MAKFLVPAIAAAMLAAPALADERTGYREIGAGNLAAAEQRLAAERRIYPQRPELMLNLAVVYGRTGRVAEARALYTAVLSADAVALELQGGANASSHVIARAGLAHLGAEQVVAR